MGMFEDYFEDLAKRNEKPAADDYMGEDGLMYCGKCHTPKQTRVMAFGKERIIGCNCKCESEAYAKRKEDEKQKEFNEKVKRLKKLGFTEARLAEYTFDNDDGSNEELSKIAKKYADEFHKFRNEGIGLLMYGNVGGGKTFMASAIANELIAKGVPCSVTSFPHLANLDIQKRQDYINNMNDFDLIVIDDLAVERNTEYMNEMVYTVIDSRYRAKLPIIVTTNLTGDEIKAATDVNKKRVYSRLFEMTFPVEVTHSDRRRAILKDRYKTMKELLT